MIPFSNGLDLHAACKAHHPLPPAWIDGGTHNNIESNYSEQYLQVTHSADAPRWGVVYHRLTD